MFPTLAYAGVSGPRLAAWLLTHADRLGPAYDRLDGYVRAALGDPGGAALDRVGGALVGTRDGQVEVLGLLHRQADTLAEVTAAVDGVRAGQQALAGAVDLVRALSAVGLGVSVLTHAALAAQYAALASRLARVETEVRRVRGILEASHRAGVTAGLTMLRQGLDTAAGNPDLARSFLTQAAAALTDSSANYAHQLGAATGDLAGGPGVDWLLARHLTVSALGEAACLLHLREPGLAVRSLEAALVPLRAHARGVFARTVGGDPARFLIPAMARHGVTLEAVAELYRQAGHAGVVGPDERLSAADRFEALRARVHVARDPRFRARAAVRRLTAAWAEAAAAVEEVNRVQGLAFAIASYQGPGCGYLDVAAEVLRLVEERRVADGDCLAVFPPAQAAVPGFRGGPSGRP